MCGSISGGSDCRGSDRNHEVGKISARARRMGVPGMVRSGVVILWKPFASQRKASRVSRIECPDVLYSGR